MELLVSLVEAVIGILVAVIEAIVGFFVAGAEALTVWEALAVLVILFVEMIWWGLLFLFELVGALFEWRKPRKVKRPIIWRPKKLKQKNGDETNK